MSDLRSNTPSASGYATFVGTIPTNVEHPPHGSTHPFVAAVPAHDAPRPQAPSAARPQTDPPSPRPTSAERTYGNARRRNPAASVTVDRPRERRSVPNSSSSRSTRFTVAREVPARLASSSWVSGTVTSSPSP